METFSALLAICVGNSPGTGEFPTQMSVTRSFDVIFDLHLNKRLSKQSQGLWFETQSCSLWRRGNVRGQNRVIIAPADSLQMAVFGHQREQYWLQINGYSETCL